MTAATFRAGVLLGSGFGETKAGRLCLVNIQQMEIHRVGAHLSKYLTKDGSVCVSMFRGQGCGLRTNGAALPFPPVATVLQSRPARVFQLPMA
jgi:hypothetical protein